MWHHVFAVEDVMDHRCFEWLVVGIEYEDGRQCQREHRRGDDDRGQSRKRSAQVQTPQHADPERDTRSEETRSHEQDAFGNAFLADLLRAGEPIRADAPPRGEGGHDLAGQDYGGVEDEDPPPSPDDTDSPLGLRMRPVRRGELPEVDPSGAGLPELRLPPEDPAWIADRIAAAAPKPWSDPAPQVSTAVLEGGLTRWVRSLARWVIHRGDLAALTLCAPPYCSPDPGDCWNYLG